MGKWRPSERKAKIGENVPSKSLVGIVGLVYYLRCPCAEGDDNQSQLEPWGRGTKRAGFVRVSGPDRGLEEAS